MLETSGRASRSRIRWLERELPGRWCVLSWLVATTIFVGLVRLLHGPSGGDAIVSIFSTWSIAHGNVACAYPPNQAGSFPFIAPLWPLISGGISALMHIGGSVPFPSNTMMGSNCSSGLTAMARWSTHSDALPSTLRIGYVSWLFVMGGVVALLRATGRGRTGWEAVTVIAIACMPPVFMPLQQYFHACDLVAMGLILGGLACVRRGRWGWAGVLLALAVLSQQFALLVLAPLVVIAPRDRRSQLLGTTLATSLVVVVPLVVLTSGRVLGPVLLGSGDSRAFGGTVIWEMHLHGAVLVSLCRVAPIVLSMALAWLAVTRLGDRVLEAVPLLSLVGTALALRLVFEINLWGYYFMAVTLALLMVDIIRGKVRWSFLLWLAVVSFAFDPPPWGSETLHHAIPVWLFQIVLVPAAVALAAGPLFSAVRGETRSDLDPDLDQVRNDLIPATI
jgi:hypothetical protein